MKWTYETSILSTIVDSLWNDRNWLGKILFAWIWPIGILMFIINDGLDLLEHLTSKKEND